MFQFYIGKVVFLSGYRQLREVITFFDRMVGFYSIFIHLRLEVIEPIKSAQKKPIVTLLALILMRN